MEPNRKYALSKDIIVQHEHLLHWLKLGFKLGTNQWPAALTCLCAQGQTQLLSIGGDKRLNYYFEGIIIQR
jgi:hypothetical protein